MTNIIYNGINITNKKTSSGKATQRNQSFRRTLIEAYRNYKDMDTLKQGCKRLTNNIIFEFFITGIILLNSVLVGVETFSSSPTIKLIQSIILGIFTIEIIIRFIAADNLKSFFFNGWNIFDLSLVIIGYIPVNMFANASMIMALRVLRVFRVLRLLRAAKEIKLIMTVLVKSLSAMLYNLIIFLIFVYLYALIGVSVFKLPNPNALSEQDKVRYEQFIAIAPHAPANSPDPFGDIGEAVFTLFRELTGEDWTDLRYNHITAYKYGFIKTPPILITSYHVSWFCLSALLLLNLVTGAIINNYQIAIDEQEKRKQEQKEKRKKAKKHSV